jgi:muramoyltetrapeptide carboxypeptidase
VEGTLWGGNLAMLTSLIGTPWLPQIRDGILVLEDINEHPFRVERMLLQLLHSGPGGAESGDLRQLHRQRAERL